MEAVPRAMQIGLARLHAEAVRVVGRLPAAKVHYRPKIIWAAVHVAVVEPRFELLLRRSDKST